MLSLRQLSLSAVTVLTTATLSVIGSTAAQAAIIGGQVTGVWQEGFGDFNAGDPFTVDYTYDDANITTETWGYEDFSETYGYTALLSLVIYSGSSGYLFDLDSSENFGEVWWYKAQNTSEQDGYSIQENGIYAQNLLEPAILTYFIHYRRIFNSLQDSEDYTFASLYQYDQEAKEEMAGASFSTYSERSVAIIPTPVLLPGLIGLGLGVLRKRKAQVALEKQRV